jgi:hypothetical protein
MNAVDLIGQYIKLRDFIERRAAEHAKELEPYQQGMEAIKNMCSAMLVEQGGEEGKSNIATPAGTVYRKKWTSIKVADRPTWMHFVTQDWDDRNRFVTAAVAKKEIEEFIEINKIVPPGLDLSSGYETYFNKPKG